MVDNSESQIDIEEIAEVGAKRAKALREAGYSTIDDIRAASLDDLLRVRGIGRSLAVNIKNELEHEFGGSRSEQIEHIRSRWSHHEFERWYWIPRPATVRILLYADSGSSSTAGASTD